MRRARFDGQLIDKQTKKFLNNLSVMESDNELASEYDCAIIYPCQRVTTTESRKVFDSLVVYDFTALRRNELQFYLECARKSYVSIAKSE